MFTSKNSPDVDTVVKNVVKAAVEIGFVKVAPPESTRLPLKTKSPKKGDVYDAIGSLAASGYLGSPTGDVW
jgi:hypothetical protein